MTKYMLAIILMGNRGLVALLSLSSWCLVIVVLLFLAVPWVCLQVVIVVFLIILTYFVCIMIVHTLKMCTLYFGTFYNIFLLFTDVELRLFFHPRCTGVVRFV